MNQPRQATSPRVAIHREDSDRLLSDPRPILISLPNWLGDAVMGVPALRLLREAFRGSRVTLFGRNSITGLFEGEDLSDDIVSVRNPRDANRLTSLLGEVRIQRRTRAQIVVLLPNSFRSALVARAAGIGIRAGYAADARSLLLTLPVRMDPESGARHQIQQYLSLARGVIKSMLPNVEVPAVSNIPVLTAGEEARSEALETLRNEGIECAGFIALNPGATNSRAKRWLPDRFAETADRLSRELGFATVIVGTRADVEVANQTATMMQTPALVMAGRTSIVQLKGLLACASLMITNDTGAAHLSAALGVPTVTVFGPTRHLATHPVSPRAQVVRHDVECSPCMLRDCPIDHRCMTGVEVAAVAESARRLLGSGRREDRQID